MRFKSRSAKVGGICFSRGRRPAKLRLVFVIHLAPLVKRGVFSQKCENGGIGLCYINNYPFGIGRSRPLPYVKFADYNKPARVYVCIRFRETFRQTNCAGVVVLSLSAAFYFCARIYKYLRVILRYR